MCNSMLSYQHAYHAGNPADVVKHTLWGALLAHMTAKPKPLWVAETHAGRGLYPVNEPEMAKLQEYATGLSLLLPNHTLQTAYMQATRALNAGQNLQIVPGSPAVAAHVLRQTDALHLCEAHPAEVTSLRRSMASLAPAAAVHVHATDGHTQIPALTKPGQRTAVLIDPSYEVKTEYLQTARTVQAILSRNPQAVIMVWAPVLPDERHQPLLKALSALAIPATWQATYVWNPTATGLIGTSQTILNLPYPLEDTLPALLTATIAPLATTFPNASLTTAFLTPRR